MKALTITISRQYGSGGRAIAQQLSKDLNLPWYDHEIISKAARESDIGAWEFSAAENMQLSDYLYALSDITPGSRQEQLTYGERIFQAQSRALEKLADRGPAIFLGRCGNYLLAGRPRVLRVFIHAPLEARMARVAAYSLAWSQREVAKHIRVEDHRRAAYYHYYTGEEWRDAAGYDLSLDSEKLGEDGCADFIRKALPLFVK